MLPLRDDIPTRRLPIANYTVIALCALTFLLQLQDQPGELSMVEKYGMIPARVQDPNAPVEVVVGERHVQTPRGIERELVTQTLERQAVPAWMTLLTCIFLHGGWMHFLGNMWFLHIFGDNVEDRFGHLGYVVFYLGCGVAASFVHFISGPGSTVPTIGASGAIAGVMGAYFVWYPHARVEALIPLGYIMQIVVVPAPLFLGVWFLFQAFQGTMTMSAAEGGGVAWWAHTGGFVAGCALAFFLGRSTLLFPKNQQRRPEESHRVNLLKRC
ncbi:Rhomboid protease GluP [Thalassoglobus neptunius]|uniref:Rhomboid protease GluP n=1 Tax=Thalassoglobus neptunius TaxID=1938619 RepID=A0A5C5X749_9PLAN|nr:rhomboid family intramembrane serine protease [Thalassoglobus neptunius]TWT58489.1 Rhomboid protease GluP [Thalassoglobus neptunius]